MLIEIYTLNIYSRMRKVINFDKMKRKNWKKKFLRGLTTPHFCPFAPSPPLYWKYFTYFVILLVITSPILYNFFFSFFFTMLCYHKMLSHHNYLIFNTLHAYFSVCYFIPSQLFLRIFIQFACIFIRSHIIKHFLILFLKFINILKHI